MDPQTSENEVNERIIIGLGGRKYSGKDALADYLVQDHGYTKHEMSSVLNEIMEIINPWVVVYEDIEGFEPGTLTRYKDLVAHVGYVKAKEVGEVRRLLQMLGTEVGRNILHQDVWVNVMREKILATEGHVVFTGVRYPNELALVRELSGVAAWVERPGLEDHQAELAAHSSEGSVHAEDFDIKVVNDSDLDGLRRLANEMHMAITAQDDRLFLKEEGLHGSAS